MRLTLSRSRMRGKQTELQEIYGIEVDRMQGKQDEEAARKMRKVDHACGKPSCWPAILVVMIPHAG